MRSPALGLHHFDDYAMKFEVRPSLPEDVDAGSVLLTLSTDMTRRGIVKVKREGGSAIFCEALGLDRNFVDRYNRRRESDFPSKQLRNITYDASGRALPDRTGQGLIFINEYYRARLGPFEQGTVQDLTISQSNGWWGRTRACLQHPQVGIRLSTQLGLWGLALGSLATLLGGIGVWLGILAVRK